MKNIISGMIHSPARINNRWDIAGGKKKKGLWNTKPQSIFKYPEWNSHSQKKKKSLIACISEG